MSSEPSANDAAGASVAGVTSVVARLARCAAPGPRLLAGVRRRSRVSLLVATDRRRKRVERDLSPPFIAARVGMSRRSLVAA